jgi:hypothetical protein
MTTVAIERNLPCPRLYDRGEVGHAAGTTERERYASALAGLWESLASTLSQLEAVSADVHSLDDAGARLPVLQNRLHWAGELVAGIEPPPGAEGAHAELARALECARDATGDVRDVLETEGAPGAWLLVHEWRGALFGVRFARHRLGLGAPPAAPAAEQADGLRWSAALATALVLAGTAAFTAGAIAVLWPVWALGLGLVAASFLVFEP